MVNPIIDLGNLLKEETDIFHRLYKLEQEKSAAIIQRDGEILESISCKQEELLKIIEPLESNRVDIIERYREIGCTDNLSGDLMLKDIAAVDEAYT